LLKCLGASQLTGKSQTLSRKLELLFEQFIQQVATKQQDLSEIRPILEFISRRYSDGWLLLGELFAEPGELQNYREAIVCLTRYIESPVGSTPHSMAWRTIAYLAEKEGDYVKQLHALSEMCCSEGAPAFALAAGCRKINSLLASEESRLHIDWDVRREFLQKTVEAVDARIDELDATTCSSLAWLYLSLADKSDKSGKYRSRAVEVVEMGLRREQTNRYCQKLLERLETPAARRNPT